MRTIIAGSRAGFTYWDVEFATTMCTWKITEVICGMANGVDLLGRAWAKTNSIPVREFPADWKSGKHAGFARNTEMAKNADAAIILWDGKSSGTRHMITEVKKFGLKLSVLEPE